MILTLDIGNTNIKVALFDGENLAQYWRISTDRAQTSDEYGMLLANLFAFHSLGLDCVEGIMISSVVPTVNFTIEHMCDTYFHQTPHFLHTGMPLGISVRYDNPRELGTDRLANAVAAQAIYGGPCIFIDFGTATSYGVIDAAGQFVGGAIAPGVKLSAEALTSGAAKLPRVELVMPASVIGTNTVSNMQSGLIYGNVGAVRYMVERMRGELGDASAKVIATGGLARLVDPDGQLFDTIDGLLTLKGLRIVYERLMEGSKTA